MYINQNISSLNRLKPAEGRSDFLRLDMNESPEGLPDDFVSEVSAKITPTLLSMYPETGALRQLLADQLGVSQDNISLGNGSDDLLRTIFSVFGEANKAIVAVDPTFAMYPIYAKMNGMQTRLLTYSQNSFEVSIQDLLNLIDDSTGIVSLVNPNNPMGNVYTEDEVINVLEKAKKYGALVIVDEAYYYYYPETMVHLIHQYSNLIITRTFSKLCALAGLRLGYAVAAPELIQLLDMARPSYCVNSVAILFATELLKKPSLIDWLVQREKEGRHYLCTLLEKNQYSYICKQSNFIFIKTKKSPELLKQALFQNHVLVKTYQNPVVKDYIRISTGGIDMMRKFWNIFLELDAQ